MLAHKRQKYSSLPDQVLAPSMVKFQSGSGLGGEDQFSRMGKGEQRAQADRNFRYLAPTSVTQAWLDDQWLERDQHARRRRSMVKFAPLEDLELEMAIERSDE